MQDRSQKSHVEAGAVLGVRGSVRVDDVDRHGALLVVEAVQVRGHSGQDLVVSIQEHLSNLHARRRHAMCQRRSQNRFF